MVTQCLPKPMILCVKHHYIHLAALSSDEVDFVTETLLSCLILFFFFFLFLCVLIYNVHIEYINRNALNTTQHGLRTGVTVSVADITPASETERLRSNKNYSSKDQVNFLGCISIVLQHASIPCSNEKFHMPVTAAQI